MGYKHTNVRGASITPAQEKRCFELARQLGDMEQRCYGSMSGADVSGAPMYGIERRFYLMVWEGCDVEEAIEHCRAQWVAYAEENNAKVNSAPKIKRGPMSGHSAISHRWTDPGRFDSKAIHFRVMARQILAIVD